MDKVSVCVVGLGYVGLPTACILANAGYKVLGVDNCEQLLADYQSLNYLTTEPELQDLLCKVVTNHALQFSTSIMQAAIYIITVPTPISNKLEPNITYVEDAIAAIAPNIKPGNLIIIESTCPIGTTDNITDKLRAVCTDIYVAYCPERILPGNIIYELRHNNRVVGGIDKASAVRAWQFYQTFSSGNISLTDAKTAEAVKLAENTYRDINIAYANELSLIAGKLDIDIERLINLANEHPRVNILAPGIGVGGHCLAVDPYFLIFAAPTDTNLIATARKVNDKKSDWVANKITRVAKHHNIKTILCLGLSYKPDVSDFRNSPAVKIVKLLADKFKVLSVDPYQKHSPSLTQAITQAEMVVTLVAHKQFINISTQLPKHIIHLDFTGRCQ